MSEKRCCKCEKAVTRSSSIYALGNYWHQACFRCHDCGLVLGEFAYEHNAKPYCYEDYVKNSAKKCVMCSRPIQSQMMIAKESFYHAECFQCCKCHVVIESGAVFTLLGTDLFCSSCAVTRSPVQKRHTPEGVKRTSEIFRQSVVEELTLQVHIERPKHQADIGVEFSQTYDNQGIRHIFISKIHEGGISAQSGCFQVGDEIIRFNGRSVAPASIESLQKVISTHRAIYMSICRRIMGRETHPEDASGSAQSAITAPSTPPAPSSTLHSPSSRPVSASPKPEAEKKVKSRTVFGWHWTRKSSAKKKEKGDKHDKHSEKHGKEEAHQADVEEDMDAVEADIASNIDDTPLSPLPPSSVSSSSVDNSIQHQVSELSVTDEAVVPKWMHARRTRVFRLEDIGEMELIGQGFYGNVYKAHHKHTKQPLVLKELQKYDQTSRVGFLKEVSILKTLSHPNVLQFIGMVSKEGKMLLIIEFLEHGSLAEWIQDKSKPFAWFQRLRALRDIACGMNYLHGKGIMHRDLTSSNCLLHTDNTVVIADFGLAKILRNTSPSSSPDLNQCRESTSSPSLSISTPPPTPSSLGPPEKKLLGKSPLKSMHSTEARAVSPMRSPAKRPISIKRRMTIVGNPFWMSPEMMKGQPYNNKADIFSFGIIVCEVLARVISDPDILPRSKDFGVDWEKLGLLVPAEAPGMMFQLAMNCCALDVDRRPEFDQGVFFIDDIEAHGMHKQRSQFLPSAPSLPSYPIPPGLLASSSALADQSATVNLEVPRSAAPPAYEDPSDSPFAPIFGGQ